MMVAKAPIENTGNSGIPEELVAWPEVVVVAVVVVDDCAGCTKKSAGSISAGSGAWPKSNIDIMLLALTSLAPREGRLKVVSANFSSEPNPY